MSDQAHWENKLSEVRTGQLDTVRKSATAWSALFSSLLGVFGVVAFAGGLKEIDDLAPDFTILIKVVTSLAALALATATFFSAKAAGLFTATTNNTTWQQLRDTTTNDAHSANGDLRIAKIAGVVAVILVLGGTAAAIWGPSAESPPATVIVDTPEGVACGKLSRDGGAIVVDGKTVESVGELSVVSRCPDAAEDG